MICFKFEKFLMMRLGKNAKLPAIWHIHFKKCKVSEEASFLRKND